MTSKFLSPFFAALILGTAAVSCGKDKPVTSETSEVATTRDGQVYVIDTMNSRIEWKGFKVLKSENTSHFGTIKFETGDVTVKDGQLESGKFVADMTSLDNVDLQSDAEQKAKLEGHLKSGDFFEVEKFPTASYEITKVSPLAEGDYNTLLEGNLTIKGITKPVKFNANVAVSQGEVSIATEPTDIMREDYGVKFQMPVQNGLIKNEVNVQIRIKAMEQK
ncbi:YceI family protein [Marnyiella aurantia]|uniref:YceI family protein n=1 Tax=Marnyiella aurantia TaxID=2758037 RepID=A0A7D7LR96_9FLAO|nr:YceI family protein [Marnyiella aurantia]MBA5246669.1 YceI family protein [Marnyiella aurantia]MBP0612462.1 YceI family protein [Marnyiella aurantia]QMS97978.1 YceI family protein [Marnyiella aurantia]